MLTISNNKASISRNCLKKYHWRYNEKLTPIRKSTALTLGSSVHSSFDMFYNGFTVKEVVANICSTFDDDISKVSLSEQEDLVIAKYTALGMFSHFPFKDLSKFESIDSEKPFSIRIGNLRGVRFEGRIDGLVKKDGLWWVRELKTTGLNQRQFDSRVKASSQATGYVYAMRKLGFDVKGILYDYIKKPLLRKRVSEDQETFGNRILQDYALKPEMYFGQKTSWRTQTEINLWEEDMIATVRDIRRRKAFPRNTDACFNYNSECPYFKICFEEQPDPLMLKLYFKKEGRTIQ